MGAKKSARAGGEPAPGEEKSRDEATEADSSTTARPPLHGVERINGTPGPVVIHETPDAADAAQAAELFGCHVAPPYLDGPVDYSALRDRSVVIVRNLAPHAGEVARALARCAEAAGARRARLVSLPFPRAFPKGLIVNGDVPEWLDAGGPPAAWTKLLAEAASEPLPLAVRRLADVAPKPIRWLWPGRIARGKPTVIAGNPGLGKSQTTASLAAIVSTGGPWPVDRSLAEVGSVVILSAEDDAEDTLRPRLEAAGADLERVFVLDAVPEVTQEGGTIRRAFNLRTDLPRLGDLLTKLGQVALVVIDPVTAYLGEVDSHRNAEVRALLAPLADLAAQHEVAVLLVSHLTKGAGGDAMMRVTGSLAFVAASRAAFIVARDPQDPDRRLFLPAKNNLGPDQTGLAFRVRGCTLPGGIDTSRVEWEAEAVAVSADEALAPQPDAHELSATDEAQEWLRDLLATGPLRAADVQRQARQAGLSDKALRRARERMRIKPTKGGFAEGWWWDLPDREDAQAAQDAQAGNMGTLGGEGHLREPRERVTL